MDKISPESVLSQVRDELLRSVKSPAQRDLVTKWFEANASLLLLSIANTLDMLALRAARKQALASERAQTRPAEEKESKAYPFVDPLGREITLNSDDPDGELIEKLRQWLNLEPGQSSVWSLELEDSAEPDSPGKPLLQAMRPIGEWDFDAHFGNRKGLGPKIWSNTVDPLYETLQQQGYVEEGESHAYLFRAVTAFVASLVCPNPQILGRADYALLNALAACAANLEHARQAAGWDYRPAIEAAAYDALYVRYQRKLPARESFLTDRRRACLDHRPLGPVFFAAFTNLFRFDDLDTERWWRVSRFVGIRADHFIPGQGQLSVVEPDTAGSVLFEAIAAEMPALKPFICFEGEENDRC